VPVQIIDDSRSRPSSQLILIPCSLPPAFPAITAVTLRLDIVRVKPQCRRPTSGVIMAGFRAVVLLAATTARPVPVSPPNVGIAGSCSRLTLPCLAALAMGLLPLMGSCLRGPGGTVALLLGLLSRKLKSASYAAHRLHGVEDRPEPSAAYFACSHFHHMGDHPSPRKGCPDASWLSLGRMVILALRVGYAGCALYQAHSSGSTGAPGPLRLFSSIIVAPG